MARIRTIKPELFHHEGLCDLPIETRYLFMGMLCHADRAGRLPDRPRRIKAQVLPYEDITPAQVDGMLEALASHPEAFLLRYEVEGQKVIQITSFLRHQRPTEKEPQSDLPPPVGWEVRHKDNPLGKAIEFLVTELSDGPRSPSELKTKAASLGLNLSTLDRARKKIGVLSKPSPLGRKRKLWSLPESSDVFQKMCFSEIPNEFHIGSTLVSPQEGVEETLSENGDVQCVSPIGLRIPPIGTRCTGKGREELPSRYYLPSNFKEKEKKIEKAPKVGERIQRRPDQPTAEDLEAMYGKRRPARAISGGAA